MAGALRDQKRPYRGRAVFGSWARYRTSFRFSDGSGLKLTVALYYTPSGSSIQAEGIVPDVEVLLEAPRTDDKDNARLMVREQDLNRHLENGKDKKSAKAKTGKEDAAEQLARDNQLRMALQMVKSLPRCGKSGINPVAAARRTGRNTQGVALRDTKLSDSPLVRALRSGGGPSASTALAVGGLLWFLLSLALACWVHWRLEGPTAQRQAASATAAPRAAAPRADMTAGGPTLTGRWHWIRWMP